MSDLTIGVFALQGDVREHLRALAAADVIARPVRRPAELDEVDGLVIPGGESTVMSKLSLDFGLFDPIAARIAAGMPAFGSCAGMIMLAGRVLDGRDDQRCFGGIDMTVRRNAFGRQVDSFEATVPIAEIAGGPVRAVFIRAPWVEQVGPDVTVLGRVDAGAAQAGGGEASEGEAGAAAGTHEADEANEAGAAAPGSAPISPAARIVAVRQANLLATSFHPELTGDLRIHHYFVEMVRAHVAAAAGSTTKA